MGVTTVHASAIEGYQAVGAAYEKGRAGYPSDAVVYLLQRLGVMAPSTPIVEVAAGTGKFTRALLAAGATPLAIEPVAHMRDTFAQTTPGVDVLDGTAEALPLADGSAAAVLAAQAFHWFDGAAALAEFRRVLAPGGGVGLVWNGQDRRIDWVEAIWREVDARRDDTPHAWSYAWKAAFSPDSGFAPLESCDFGHDHPTDRAGLVARVTSISFIARQSADAQQPLVDHVLRVCDEAGLPERFVLPYTCHVHWCRRT